MADPTRNSARTEDTAHAGSRVRSAEIPSGPPLRTGLHGDSDLDASEVRNGGPYEELGAARKTLRTPAAASDQGNPVGSAIADRSSRRFGS